MPIHPPLPPFGASQALAVGFAGSIGRDCFSDLLLRAGAELEPSYASASRRSLLASLAAGELDVAVYPGAPSPGAASALLCHDRLAVAVAPGHPLDHGRPVPLAGLRDHPLLLPADGDEGEFRRLARALLPELGPAEDVSARDLPRRLVRGGAVALVAAGQADELGGGACLLDLDDARARFAVQISWTRAAADAGFRRLLPELGV